MNPLPGTVNRAKEKIAKPIKPAVEHVPKPVEDAKVPKPQNSVTAANGGVRTPLAQRKPTAPKALRTDGFNKMTDKFVKPDRFEKMARPPGKNNDVPDTKDGSMDTSKLLKTFNAERAAQRAFNALAPAEVAAYVVANMKTVFAESASEHSWWKSLTPKQQIEYRQLHPNSKLGRSGVALQKDPVEDDAAWSKAHSKITNRLVQKAASLQPHPAHVAWLRKAATLASASADQPLNSAQHKAYVNHVNSPLPKVGFGRAATPRHAKLAKDMVGTAKLELENTRKYPDEPDMVGWSAERAANHLQAGLHLHNGDDDKARRFGHNFAVGFPESVYNHLNPSR